MNIFTVYLLLLLLLNCG